METIGEVIYSYGREKLIRIPLKDAKFCDWQYQHNRTLDLKRIENIKSFLRKYYTDYGYVPYVTGGWTVFIGRIQGTTDERCLDGQHRWCAAYDIEKELNIGLTMNFLITDYQNEEERLLSFMVLSQSKEMENMFMNNIPGKVQDQFKFYQNKENDEEDSFDRKPVVVKTISQGLIRKHFQEKVIGLIMHEYPLLIKRTKTVKKPNLDYTKLCDFIDELTDIVESKAEYPNLYFPTIKDPLGVFNLIKEANAVWIGLNDETLEKYIPTQKGVCPIQKIRDIGSVMAYQKVFWDKFFKVIRYKNRRCKVMDSKNFGITLIEENFEDAIEP